MINRKKIVAVLLTLSLMVVTAGCFTQLNETFQYTFRQDRGNIIKVEICAHDYKDNRRIEPLVTLNEEEIDEILDSISSLECHHYGIGDHQNDYGDLLICITYSNKEVEVIGLTNIGWIRPDGGWRQTNYLFHAQDILSVLDDYVDTQTLKDVSDWI